MDGAVKSNRVVKCASSGSVVNIVTNRSKLNFQVPFLITPISPVSSFLLALREGKTWQFFLAMSALSALDTSVGKSLNTPHSQSDGRLYHRAQGVGQGSTQVTASHVFKERTARKIVTLFSFLHDKEKLGVGLNSSKVSKRKLLGFWVGLGKTKAVAWIYISDTQGFNPLLSFRMQGGTDFQLHWEFRSTLLTQRKTNKQK